MNGTTNSWCTSHSSHFFINFGLADGAFCATIQVIDEGIKQYQTQLSHFGYTTTRLHLDFVSLVTVFWACFSRSFFSLSHYLVFCQPVYDAAGGSFKYYNIEVNNIHCSPFAHQANYLAILPGKEIKKVLLESMCLYCKLTLVGSRPRNYTLWSIPWEGECPGKCYLQTACKDYQITGCLNGSVDNTALKGIWDSVFFMWNW